MERTFPARRSFWSIAREPFAGRTSPKIYASGHERTSCSPRRERFGNRKEKRPEPSLVPALVLAGCPDKGH